MESLALLVAIIAAPALFGGPVALILTFWRQNKISKFRKISIWVLSIPALITGIFLIVTRASSGATMIGSIGVITAIAAVWRLFE
jgi:hypothetical protein